MILLEDSIDHDLDDFGRQFLLKILALNDLQSVQRISFNAYNCKHDLLGSGVTDDCEKYALRL